MFKGKNKPHLYTWISITIITIMVAYLQVIGSAALQSVLKLLVWVVEGGVIPLPNIVEVKKNEQKVIY